MKTGSRGIPLNYFIGIPVWRSMKRAILTLHEKYLTVKINGQTFEYEINVQALKDTSWIKPRYLARSFLC